jgi:hypothetical protein
MIDLDVPLMPTESLDSTETPDVNDADKANKPEPVDTPDELNEKIAKYLKECAASSEKHIKTYYSEWKRNVELRIGHIGSQYTGGLNVEDEVQTEINPDWSLTKTKTANLYSQVPTVQMTHENKQFEKAVPGFCKALNYEIGPKRANVGVVMEENLNDVVNAAGVAAMEVSYVARFASKLVPAVDQMKAIPPEQLKQLGEPTEVPEGTVVAPEMLKQMLANRQVPMLRAEQVASYKFAMSRVPPTELLVPAGFTGSNFDDGLFVGRKGRMPWAMAKSEFKLSDEDKEKVVQAKGVKIQESLRSGPDEEGVLDTDNVNYKALYYWRHMVDPDEKYLTAIWKIAWVEGLEDKPAIHEQWSGQKLDEERGHYVGACRFPIRVLTITYISDNPIPPSDSSAGRPQVNDMQRSRSQLFQQRERSIPIRGFDVNKVDPLIANKLMRGEYEGMIPFNGSAQNSIWEVARASYPAEDMSFDQQVKQDLLDSWQVSPSQMFANQGGKKTSAETNMVQQSFATRIGQDRAQVARYFLGACEVLAGLMVLYSDFPTLTDQERQQMQQAWDQKHILHELVLKILPDSTIVLDAQAQIDKLMKFLNMTVKSGFVNPQPIIVKIAELSGIDPSEVIIKPQPKVEEPNVSFSFGGKDDLQNAMVVATMIEKKVAPSMESVQAARKLIQSAGVDTPPAPPTGSSGPGAGPVPPGAHPPVPGGPPGQPAAAHPQQGDAHPDWQMASKVAKRSREMGGGG